jgi:hypothetical protein
LRTQNSKKMDYKWKDFIWQTEEGETSILSWK